MLAWLAWTLHKTGERQERLEELHTEELIVRGFNHHSFESDYEM